MFDESKKGDTTTLAIGGRSAILVFDLVEEKQAFQEACDAGKLTAALSDIHEKVWRPRYKHGYSGRAGEIIETINKALEPLALKDLDGEALCAESLIEELNKLYREILEYWEVSHYG